MTTANSVAVISVDFWNRERIFNLIKFYLTALVLPRAATKANNLAGLAVKVSERCKGYFGAVEQP